jgi:Ca2+-binding EF-hand superfamily protein
MIGPFVSVTVGATSFETVDSDSSGTISKPEYAEAVRNSHTYRDWDSDDNSFIDAEEFKEAGIAQDFEQWDADSDGFLEPTEFYDAVFAAYDKDEDGRWSSGECARANEDGFFKAWPPE